MSKHETLEQIKSRIFQEVMQHKKAAISSTKKKKRQRKVTRKSSDINTTVNNETDSASSSDIPPKKVPQSSDNLDTAPTATVNNKPSAVITTKDKIISNPQTNTNVKVNKQKSEEPLQTVNSKQDTRINNKENMAANNQTHYQSNIPTRNMYEALADNQEAEENHNMQTDDLETCPDKSTQKLPPPLVIHGHKTNHAELLKTIKQHTEGEFNIKYTRNNINVTIHNNEDKNKYMQTLKNQQVEFHTYTNAPDKTHAFVIRGLANDVTTQEITAELNNKHGLHTVNCFKMTLHPHADSHRALFLLITKNDITLNYLTAKIKYALHTRVYFERRRNSKRITQCHKCQAWGHATANCHANVKCLFCAEKHDTKDCLNKEALKCANCNGKHKSNDTTCKIYTDKIEWLEKNKRQREQQRPSGYTYTPRNFPPLYTPAPPPASNPWKQQPAQQPPRPQHHHQQSNPHQQYPPNEHNQQQPQQQPHTYVQPQQQPRYTPPTHTGTPPITYTTHTESLQELTTQLHTLNTLVNIKELIRAIKDINHTLESCHTKQDKFLAFTQFTQSLDKYDI